MSKVNEQINLELTDEQVDRAVSIIATSLKDQQLKVVASLAATEAVKEAVAFLATEGFKTITHDVDRKIEKGINESLKKQEQARIKAKGQQQKRIIKNTETLIKNYRKCREMVKGFEFETNGDEGTFLASDELTLEKLEQQHAKTYKMVRRIEGALAACEAESKCGNEEERIRFAIMKKRYIDDKRLSVRDCMELFNVSQSKVYSDTTKAMKDMSSYIFGYDAVIFD